jgi:hypothetical protein
MNVVRTAVSQELFASIIRMKGISELGTTLAVTSNRSTLPRNLATLMMEAINGTVSEGTFRHLP